MHKQWFNSIRMNDLRGVQKLIKQGINPFLTLKNQTARQIVKGYITKLSRMGYKDTVRIYMYNQMYYTLVEAEQQIDQKSCI